MLVSFLFGFRRRSRFLLSRRFLGLAGQVINLLTDWSEFSLTGDARFEYSAPPAVQRLYAVLALTKWWNC